MISALAWVPAGVAASVPKRYEMSAAERELIQLMDEQGNIDQVEAKIKQSISKREEGKKNPAAPASAECDLPADLRMDEYSSDEESEDENRYGVAVGNMLVGQTSDASVPVDMIPEEEKEEEETDVESDEGGSDNDEDVREAKKGRPQRNSDHDSDDDDGGDELDDIPDTREYMPIDVEGLQAMEFGGNAPYMEEFVGDDDDSEIEDVKLTADDALILVAKTEDVSCPGWVFRFYHFSCGHMYSFYLDSQEFATLEVNVYDRKTGNLYVHHDIPLPAYPLCLAHGQVSAGGTAGNFCAVGTFNPGIEIWNLDVLNALEPSCVLGGEDTSTADDLMKLQILGRQSETKRKKKKGGSSLRPGSHTDAVMSLSWNQIHQQVIASGSADCTVKLWDVTRGGSEDAASANASTFRHHKGKVQAVEWHPKEGTLLATGAYDRTVALVDARSDGENVKKVKLSADCESIAWDPCKLEYLTVASEDGTICCWDVRKFETANPLWKIEASEFGGISDISYNAHVPGLLATCSLDKTVALWDTHKTDNNSKNHPQLCSSKDMCSGKLYSVSFYPSSPWLLGTGGSGNQLALWDMSEESSIQSRFKVRDFDAPSSELAVEAENAKSDELQAMLSATIEEKGDDSSNFSAAEKAKKKDRGKAKGKKKIHRKGR